MKKAIQTARNVGAILGLLLLCSCAAAYDSSSRVPAVQLPAGLRMNKDAGRGNLLFVAVQLPNRENLLFILDTGTPMTCLDKRLEPRLGERVDKYEWWHFGVRTEENVYREPGLYSGGVLLKTSSSNVVTLDLRELSLSAGYPVAGILGMDILRHYCVQLDFAANKVRFLDGQRASRRGWGKSFSWICLDDACPVLSENLAGGNSPGSLIDTGCNTDGWLTAAVFQQWTNQASPVPIGHARYPSGALAGEMYPGINLSRLGEDMVSTGDSHVKLNGIGLRFLARHLVTLDGPGQTLYLKRTSVGPLSIEPGDWRARGKSAYKFLRVLKKKGQLPGWLETDQFASNTALFHSHSCVTGTVELRKKGDPSIYNYQVIQASEGSQWKLQKAWRTDPGGNTLEYVIPDAVR